MQSHVTINFHFYLARNCELWRLNQFTLSLTTFDILSMSYSWILICETEIIVSITWKFHVPRKICCNLIYSIFRQCTLLICQLLLRCRWALEENGRRSLMLLIRLTIVSMTIQKGKGLQKGDTACERSWSCSWPDITRWSISKLLYSKHS